MKYRQDVGGFALPPTPASTRSHPERAAAVLTAVAVSTAVANLLSSKCGGGDGLTCELFSEMLNLKSSGGSSGN